MAATPDDKTTRLAHPPPSTHDDSRRVVPARAIWLLVVLTLIWGTNWPLFPVALREVSVWTFRAVSVGTAGAFLLGISRLRGLSLAVPRRHWGTLLGAALSYLVVWNIASAYSTILIPSGQTAVLGFTMPLWAALISWACLGEPMTGRLFGAVALGGAGVALLIVPGLHAYANAPLGFACGLIAGLGWALGTLLLKRRPVPAPATVVTGWQLLLSAVPITIGALIFGDGRWFVPSAKAIAAIAYITFVPMSLGNVCWFAIVGLLPANVAGLSTVLIPVVAMVSGALVHGEPLGVLQLGAMVCSVGALSLALFRGPSRLRGAAKVRIAAGGRSTGLQRANENHRPDKRRDSTTS